MPLGEQVWQLYRIFFGERLSSLSTGIKGMSGHIQWAKYNKKVLDVLPVYNPSTKVQKHSVYLLRWEVCQNL